MTPNQTILLVAALLVVLAAVLVLWLRRVDFVGWQRARLEGKLRRLGMVQHQQQLGEASLRYWLGPEGRPPLLLIHGFGASAIWQWHPHIEALSTHYQLIMPDLLWFGDSTSTRQDYSLDYQVDTIRRLLDRLGVSQTQVVAISYGGFVAYQLGARFVDRVAKVVLIASPGRAYTQEDYDELCQRFELEHIEQLLLPTEPEGVQKLIDLASYRAWWTPRFIREQALAELFDPHRREQAALLEQLLADADELSARSARLTAPTLLIWGRYDPIFPLPLARRAADELPPPARLEILDKARHAPNLEHPAQCNRLMVEFLCPEQPAE